MENRTISFGDLSCKTPPKVPSPTYQYLCVSHFQFATREAAFVTRNIISPRRTSLESLISGASPQKRMIKESIKVGNSKRTVLFLSSIGGIFDSGSNG